MNITEEIIAKRVVKAVWLGFQPDPGTSDLDDEQPICVRMTLGDWRKARYFIPQGTPIMPTQSAPSSENKGESE